MIIFTPPDPKIPPAHQLLGLAIENGWRIVEKIPRHHNATGGNFSVQYIVENNDGRKAFLKAIDFSIAFAWPGSFVDNLKVLNDAFIFERNLLTKCSNQKMSRIVLAIDSGEIQCGLIGVPYLIFEMANGDVRKLAVIAGSFEAAWACRALHQVSVGLQQLHTSEITHQDLKPSNVLTYEGGKESKIADLGRATDRAVPAPHDNLLIPGDWTYAPPEMLYGKVLPDDLTRRFSLDMYHLGSLAVYFFTGGVLTALIEAQLPHSQRRGFWNGTYDEVLPYVQDAFDIVMGQVSNSIALDSTLDERYKNELTENIRHLCNPNPDLRGHPKNRHGFVNAYSLERFVSFFNRLAESAEHRYAVST